MRRKKPEIIDVHRSELKDVAQRARQALDDDDAEFIRRVFESYEYVADLIQQKNMTIGRLNRELFGSRSEKTADVTGQKTPKSDPAAGDQTASQEEACGGQPPSTDAEKPSTSGHGRNPADAYRGAERIDLTLNDLSAGDACPECLEGTLYARSPGVVVRITGQAPLSAQRYELEKLRCNLCGKVFTAELPEEAGTQKYDARAASMMALLKYGSGLPFNRLEGLQRNLEVPLPASTQWDVVHSFASGLAPAFEELIRQAAQGEVLHNDDTTVKILELMGSRRARADETPERTGLFTSGVVATRGGQRMALFFSGPQHAGENLADVLSQRAAELDAPIQMCDALARNLPKELETIVANCLSHARRQFVDAYEAFPEECRYVLETLGEVYHNDRQSALQEHSDEQRLRYHRAHSRQPMKRLHKWMNQQFDKRLVEPNSALGQCLRYMLKHWDKLTLFLNKAGAPLDNNICERSLKRAILHRKNSLFYRSSTGAQIGDLYMSLIHTCELNGANPFEYLTQLQLHSEEVAAEPASWMPWNFQSTLAASAEAA